MFQTLSKFTNYEASFKIARQLGDMTIDDAWGLVDNSRIHVDGRLGKVGGLVSVRAWHMLAHVCTWQHVLAYSSKFDHVLAYATSIINQPMETPADQCNHRPVYEGICYNMFAHAGIRQPMSALASMCNCIQAWAGTWLHILAYANTCYSERTYDFGWVLHG